MQRGHDLRRVTFGNGFPNGLKFPCKPAPFLRKRDNARPPHCYILQLSLKRRGYEHFIIKTNMTNVEL